MSKKGENAKKKDQMCANGGGGVGAHVKEERGK